LDKEGDLMGKGKIIPFPPRGDKGHKCGDGSASGKEGSLEENIISIFSHSLSELKEDLFGREFAVEKDLKRIEHFFFSTLIQKFRNPKENFSSYMYISQLLSRSAHLAPGYIVDHLRSQKGPGYEIARKAGDLCFILAGLFPEWLERPRRTTTRTDYILLGSYFYRQTSAGISGNRAKLFWDLSVHFRSYADAVQEAKQALFR
jgi:hypothetical protein